MTQGVECPTLHLQDLLTKQPADQFAYPSIPKPHLQINDLNLRILLLASQNSGRNFDQPAYPRRVFFALPNSKVHTKAVDAGRCSESVLCLGALGFLYLSTAHAED